MDGILQGMNAVLHVIVTGMFAMLPGLLVWTFVLGVVLLLQRLRRADLFSGRQGSGTVA